MTTAALRSLLAAAAALTLLPAVLPGALSVDFDKVDAGGNLSDGSSTEAGFHSFGVQHETEGGPFDLLRSETFSSDLGEITVTVGVDGGDATAYQGIQRGAAFYDGAQVDLAEDWAGYDSRSGASGFTLRFEGLAEGDYTLRSFHQDTLDQTGSFDVYLGGTRVLSGQDIASSGGGENPGAGNPPHAVTVEFAADGAGAVEVEYRLTSGGQSAISQKFFVINGFVLSGGPIDPGGGGVGDGGDVRINEFLASNREGRTDEDGDTSDWIEIFNPGDEAVDLAGWFLTDDLADLEKWVFPANLPSLPAGGYLLVYASGKDRGGILGEVHTSFQLDRAAGGSLALVRPDGVTLATVFEAYPRQRSDVSYGFHGSGDPLPVGFFTAPTPDRANGSAVDGFVADTTFSHRRGFYDEPFTLMVSTQTEGATIRYTTDGSEPSTLNGSVFPAAGLVISGTTTLRVAASKTGFISTNVDTQTYLFIDQIARQPTDPPGWPSSWGNFNGGRPSDYEMDPRVVDSTLPGYGIREALLDIPTLSVVMERDGFISTSRGIYTNPESRGNSWERVCSLEYILPGDSSGMEGFQEDCQIEVHGNASRRPARMQKHSFRVTFKGDLGSAKLRYPLFPESPVEEFNKIVLRACFTDSWGLASWSDGRYRPNDSQYIRDFWMKETLRDMGQPSSYGNFVHLYVNGLYWGLYNPSERLEGDFFAAHLGGEEGDWEINEDFGGGGSRWNTMMAINPASEAGYAQIQEYLDVANYADYMLLHFFADSEDWPHHNGYAAVNARSGDGLYRFFVWDQEIVLDKFSWNRYNNGSGGAALFQRLRQNPEFRLLFADRARKHLGPGGALSLEACRARYRRVADRIDKAIVAESARWGDTQRKTPYGNTVRQPSPLDDVDDDAYPPAPHAPDVYFTREDSWVVERDNVINHYLAVLHDPSDSRSILNELEANNLYPDVAPPDFTPHGGRVAAGSRVTLSKGSLLDPQPGSIYYTTDGSDPRQPAVATGDVTVLLDEGAPATALVPSLANGGAALSDAWKGGAEPFDEAGWISGTTGVGYERTPENYRDIIGLELVGMEDVNPSAFVRVPFSVDADDLAGFEFFTLKMKFDDGFVAYLNGVEVASANAPAAPAWDDTATDSHSDSAAINFQSIDISDHLGELRAGANLLALHALNHDVGSSDLLVTPRLEAGEGAAAAGISPGARLYAGPVELPASGPLRARTLHNGEWSPLTESFFVVGATPADGSNLVISKIHYRPVAPSPEEAAAGFALRSDFEYIELLNIGDRRIDLRGLSFADGVEFAFPAGETGETGEGGTGLLEIDPGGRALVVANADAFAFRYGAGLPVAGVISGGKLNDDGEHVALATAGGDVFFEFTYNDVAPWPTAADGAGAALVLRDPAGGLDPNDPTSWRASFNLGGDPGGPDDDPGGETLGEWAAGRGLAGDDAEPLADPDGDGLPNLIAFALGADLLAVPRDGALTAAARQTLDVGAGPQPFVTFSYRRRLAAADLTYTVERSHDLLAWDPAATAPMGASDNGDGTETVIVRADAPLGEGAPGAWFFRLRVGLSGP